jgi:pilus assembly protein CpaB
MHRSPRFVAASCAALVVGAATAYVVARDLAELHRRAADLGPVRPVVVAARDLPLGATVAAADLTTVPRHASVTPPGALHDPGGAVGRVVAVPVVRGAVVQQAHLAARDRAGAGALVAPGQRAVRVVPADGMRPEPGAVVDLLAALDPAVAPAAPGETGVAVARGARVLAVEDAGGDGTGSGATAGVTLLVAEDEAYDVAYAAANGVLSLALAPPEAACCQQPVP